MKPYYEHAGVTIYHGDCREVLPLLRAEAVIADPPYGVGMKYASFNDTRESLRALAADVYPLMRACAPVVAITPGVANIHLWPEPTWTLAWVPDNSPTGGSPWGFPCWQPVLVYGPDPYLARGLGRRSDVLRTAPSGDELKATTTREHPCPKPYGFVRKLITRCTVGSAWVVDPFCGTGTTLRAAKDMQMRAIGIEIEERYCEIAAKRLAQDVLPLSIEPTSAADAPRLI